MKLLALDTASAQCSVALLTDAGLLKRTAATAREHAQLLLPMVDELLAEAGVRLASLDGIAFGRGPGSFTGLRIAAAATQGLAAGAGLPVLPVSDLRALAELARGRLTHESPAVSDGWLLACMDARMGELYWGVFRNGGQPVGAAEGGERLASPVLVLAEMRALLPEGGTIVAAAGMGLSAHPGVTAPFGLAAALCMDQAEPHAEQIARLAAFDLAHGAKWLDAAAAQPVYLRDQVVQSPL